MKTDRITLIAVLAALSTVGRIFFQFNPGVQPVTSLIILTTYFLGPVSGVFVAIISTYLSNMVLGMGIWTIWQMLAWCLIALIASLISLASPKKPLIYLTVIAGFSGFFYGFVFALINFVIGQVFWPYYLAGLAFDINHAVGNIIFMMILYPPLNRLFLIKHKKA
ncbi:energy-coupling factor transport system substrate-specific component [Pelagirhabdus alkalitolerans]|uniref:Energy-coupling factor transport system substrate-specific component n=1 Tax=Pelagirhabdus alkalitolerans TaxID=1612202 RepID=A0A1G6HBC4_9BACI|nr:ECF transporter S component [Pelagirhabdus alkalitolerans]SDB91582.1 energy-coupling factor transport system substrate-specific component [Pelagirhabdus alkalitolerans]